jgi:imidazolonepropionase-like amidohydrolase
MFSITAAFVVSTLAMPLQQQTVTAITNVRIIDGNGGSTVANGTVVFQGERITAIGPSDGVAVPAGATVIDGTGKTALPGLADFHVHLIGGWDGDRVDMLGYRRYLNSLLYAGVTSVLDVGNVLPYVQQMHQEIEAGRLMGPRIYYAGPLIEGADPVWPPLSYAVSSVAQIPAYVDQLKNAGVHVVKAYGGLSLMQLGVLVREASADSLSVIVDAWESNGTTEVAATGVRAFAHISGSDMTEETIALMAQRHTANITTLALKESFSRQRLQDLDFLNHDLIANTMPRWLLQELTEEASRTLDTVDNVWVARSVEALAAEKRNAKRLFDAGIMLVAGTDAPYPGVFLGEGIHRELELLVEAGLTPLQALTAATKNAATLMDSEDEWGTLEAGKRADILVVSGNPAINIGDTRNVDLVIQGGRILDRNALEYDPDTDPGYRTGAKVSRE